MSEQVATQVEESPTRQRLRALMGRGFTVREAAVVLGISTQRVYQLLGEMGLKPPPSRRWK